MNSSKKTLVLGASPNTNRYSNMAVKSLLKHGIETVALGIKSGNIDGLEIETEKKTFDNIHTVSLYVGPSNQNSWMDYVISLKPKRIIFNPGTENIEFFSKASKHGIECVEACTLVMLNIGNF